MQESECGKRLLHFLESICDWSQGASHRGVTYHLIAEYLATLFPHLIHVYDYDEFLTNIENWRTVDEDQNA